MEELPNVGGDPWSDESWIAPITAEIKQRIQAPLMEFNFHETHLLLSALGMAAKAGPVSKEVTILDLGGGCGMYFPVIDFFSRIGLKFKYAVVDGEMNCKIGSTVFADRNEISFFDFQQDGMTKASEWLGAIDVCNCASTLHYILDWKDAILNMKNLQAQIICISRHPTPEHAVTEGYVLQDIISTNGFCGSAPVVLIPRNFLVEELKSHGYTCIAQQGNGGDASWYWQNGCTRAEYKMLSSAAFIFSKIDSITKNSKNEN